MLVYTKTAGLYAGATVKNTKQVVYHYDFYTRGLGHSMSLEEFKEECGGWKVRFLCHLAEHFLIVEIGLVAGIEILFVFPDINSDFKVLRGR